MRSAEAFAADLVAQGVGAAPPPAVGTASSPVLSPPANLVQGIIATPQDEMVIDMIGMAEAANSFRANLAVYRVAAGAEKNLLDTLS